jgi:hypothetical protein
MGMISTRLSYAAFPLLFVACTSDAATVTQWRGPELHGELRGEIEGERVDVVAQANELVCRRMYVVPNPNDPKTFADGWLDQLQVSFMVTIDGIERWYDLEFFGHDFTTTAMGTVLTVVPASTDDVAPSEHEVHVGLRWEWEQGNDLITYDELAVSGTLELRELSDTPSADGLVIPASEGKFGAFLELELPSGSVTASFTAPCTGLEVESI